MNALSTTSARRRIHPWHLSSPSTRRSVNRADLAERAGEAHRAAALALTWALHWHQAAWAFWEDTSGTRRAVLDAVAVLRLARDALEQVWADCDLEDLV